MSFVGSSNSFSPKELFLYRGRNSTWELQYLVRIAIALVLKNDQHQKNVSPLGLNEPSRRIKVKKVQIEIYLYIGYGCNIRPNGL
jgi:hypothetical protein